MHTPVPATCPRASTALPLALRFLSFAVTVPLSVAPPPPSLLVPIPLSVHTHTHTHARTHTHINTLFTLYIHTCMYYTQYTHKYRYMYTLYIIYIQISDVCTHACIIYIIHTNSDLCTSLHIHT